MTSGALIIMETRIERNKGDLACTEKPVTFPAIAARFTMVNRLFKE